MNLQILDDELKTLEARKETTIANLNAIIGAINQVKRLKKLVSELPPVDKAKSSSDNVAVLFNGPEISSGEERGKVGRVESEKSAVL